jgi:hypothetical protein
MTNIDGPEPAKDPAHAPGKRKRPKAPPARGKAELTSAEASAYKRIGSRRSVKRERHDRGRPAEHTLQGRRAGERRKER